MQIVEQTKHRSGWRVYRTLAALGVPRSVYYAWKGRDSLADQTAKPCRVYEVPPKERAGDLRVCLAIPEDWLSQAHLDDGRCGNGLRRGEHGLPNSERCGPIIAVEAIEGIER